HQQHRHEDNATIDILAAEGKGESRIEDDRGRPPCRLVGHPCFGILTMLAWTIYISFFGVLVLLLPKLSVQAARIIAMLTAMAGLAVALVGFAQQRTGTLVTVVRVP